MSLWWSEKSPLWGLVEKNFQLWSDVVSSQDSGLQDWLHKPSDFILMNQSVINSCVLWYRSIHNSTYPKITSLEVHNGEYTMVVEMKEIHTRRYNVDMHVQHWFCSHIRMWFTWGRWVLIQVYSICKSHPLMSVLCDIMTNTRHASPENVRTNNG